MVVESDHTDAAIQVTRPSSKQGRRTFWRLNPIKFPKSYQLFQQSEDFSRPWMLVRLLPNAQRYIVARFHNRQDADDHKRILYRFILAAEFEVVFDIPESDHNGDEPA